VGEGAKGYNALNLQHSIGMSKVHQDIMKFVHDKGQGSGPKDEVGSVLYNRGLIIQMLSVEAVRRAQERYGKKPLTGEQVRWGLENLALDQKKIDGLGFGGLMRPISTSCSTTSRGISFSTLDLILVSTCPRSSTRPGTSRSTGSPRILATLASMAATLARASASGSGLVAWGGVATGGAVTCAGGPIGDEGGPRGDAGAAEQPARARASEKARASACVTPRAPRARRRGSARWRRRSGPPARRR